MRSQRSGAVMGISVKRDEFCDAASDSLDEAVNLTPRSQAEKSVEVSVDGPIANRMA